MSNAVAYIIFGVVLLHLLVGFAWVIYKFEKKPSNKKKEDTDD